MHCVPCAMCSYGTVEWLRTDRDNSDRQAFQGCRAIIREVQLSNSISSFVHASTYVRMFCTCSYVCVYMLYMHMHLFLVSSCVHIYVCINYWLRIHHMY